MYSCRRASFLKALSSISTNDDENRVSSNTETKNFNRPSVQRTSLDLNSDKDYDIITFIAEQIRSNFLFQSCDHSTIVNLARHFVVCEYEPGFAIIEQGKHCMLHIHIHILIHTDIQKHHNLLLSGDTLEDSRICDMCYYILKEGECIVVKDGKTVHDVHGRIHAKGSTFLVKMDCCLVPEVHR